MMKNERKILIGSKMLFVVLFSMFSFGCGKAASKPSGGPTSGVLKTFVGQLETWKAEIPTERPSATDATPLKYADVISEKIPGETKLLERKFLEISECGGDSVFTEYFGNGMVTENGRAAIHFVGNFDTGAKGVKSGISREDLSKALGKASWSSNRVSIYSCPDPVERENGNPKAEYECAWFYFENGKLIGLTFNIKWDC